VVLDDGHGATQGGGLSRELGALQFVFGYIDGTGDDADNARGLAGYRAIGDVQPDDFAVSADAFVASGLVLACCQILPKLSVQFALAPRIIQKQAFMLPLQVIERIAEELQKVEIGGLDDAFDVVLDHKMTAMNGGQLRFGHR